MTSWRWVVVPGLGGSYRWQTLRHTDNLVSEAMVFAARPDQSGWVCHFYTADTALRTAAEHHWANRLLYLATQKLIGKTV